MESIFTANTLQTLETFLINYSFLSIIILAAFFILRGEAATLVSVYMATLGYIGWGTFIFTGLISIILGDILLYHIGKYSKTTFIGRFFKDKIASAKKLENYLRENTVKALFLSKYALGLGTVVALASGWSNIDFGEFLKFNSLSIALWQAIMIGLSYIFVSFLEIIEAQKTLDTVGLVFGITIIIFIIGEYFIQKRFEETSGIKKTNS